MFISPVSPRAGPYQPDMPLIQTLIQPYQALPHTSLIYEPHRNSVQVRAYMDRGGRRTASGAVKRGAIAIGAAAME